MGQVKKKLLVYADYYHPDVASISQILRKYVKNEFEITLIYVVPSYNGKVPVSMEI